MPHIIEAGEDGSLLVPPVRCRAGKNLKAADA
jgi:hypothetical protein